jgi:O-succinylbenzoate synthase
VAGTDGSDHAVEVVELRLVELPMVEAFDTAGGALRSRELLLVRVVVDGVDGWGECAALPSPTYSPEYVAGAAHVLRRHLVPRLWEPGPAVVGHPMAHAALRTAVLDARLRAAGRSLAEHLGADRTEVPAGAAVGLHRSIADLVATVERLVDEGYRRVKLKIAPGWDAEPVAAVRRAVGHGIVLQVDANGAYGIADADALARLDGYDLALIEQPLPADDLLGHVELASRLATPVCLDEAIVSIGTAATAIELGACEVICVKPGRLGGLDGAAAVHDLCRDAGLDAWCGGMLETGVGRAALLALAALPGFTLPGDLSATGRWYEDDLTTPVVLDADGNLPVPRGPGVGPPPDPASLARHTTRTESLPRP